MSLDLTPEQLQRRAETARANGRKSRGPKSPTGKRISSLNAISTGRAVAIEPAPLPRFLSLLSTDDRETYVELFQAQLRQFRPESDAQLNLVRHLTLELFEYERLLNLQTYGWQSHIDGLLREYPASPGDFTSFQALRRAVQTDARFYTFLERRAAAHLRAYHSFCRALVRLQRDHRTLPAEQPDITADSNVADPEPLGPAVLAEVAEQLARAQNEPSFEPYPYVIDLLDDEALIAEIAPSADLAALRRRFGRERPPLAA